MCVFMTIVVRIVKLQVYNQTNLTHKLYCMLGAITFVFD